MRPLVGRLKLNAKFTCFFLVAVWSYAFWPTISYACHRYLHSGYDYQGFLVLPMLLLLVSNRSAQLKRATLGYNPLGLVYLLFFGAVCMIATLVELELLRMVSIICMLLSIILTTCGRKITTTLSLPLLTLFLLMPLGQEFSQSVIHGFTWALMQALMFCKQAVYWETKEIFVNNQAYDIHSYLSSLKYLLLFLTLGASYAILRTRLIISSMTIAISFVVMPIVILWLSLFSYMILKQWINFGSFIETHMVSIGWTLTSLGLLHSVCLGFILRDRRDFIARTDNIDWRDSYFAHGHYLLKPIVLASCIILVMPLLSQHLKNKLQIDENSLPIIPSAIAAWKSKTITNQKSKAISFKKEQSLVSLSITHDNQKIESNWEKIKESSKKIKLTQDKLPVHETVFHNKNKYKIHWSFNFVNGHYTTNQAMAKALTHYYNLSAKDVKHGVITLSTDATKELTFARARLQEFLQDFTESEAIKNVG